MPATRTKLDQIDVRILAILQREGRITKVALAEAVNLSPTPCWERLKRLEQAGVIEGYSARISLAGLANTVTIFTEVTLARHERDDFTRFERAIRPIPEIVECWSLGGGIDYLLKIITRDIAAYQDLIDDLLAREIGVGRYFTYIVTKAVKAEPSPPVAHLLGRTRKG